MPFGYLIQTVSIVALFLFMVAFGVLLTIGILFFFVGRPSRKATLERYRMLANSDRMEIEQEAASLQNGTLLYGARRIYFTLQNSNMPCFLSYGDAALVYLTFNGIPVSENPVALSVQIGKMCIRDSVIGLSIVGESLHQTRRHSITAVCDGADHLRLSLIHI